MPNSLLKNSNSPLVRPTACRFFKAISLDLAAVCKQMLPARLNFELDLGIPA